MPVVTLLRSLWQYDIPRQSVKAFALGLGIAIACGLIITFFWRIPPSQVESVEETGRIEGRASGFTEGLRDGEEDGFFAARGDVGGLVASGTFDEGRALAFDRAWNEAIDRAIEEASHTPVIQLRRITYWESLRR
ncbi:MAG: hypothetical protein F4Z51_06355 [Chloroflexi bacterium]|nr:hypothetical protein [Chloroflexota bacterium]MYD15816.1 hypothetical protein [Chloroflexota bacterium]MYJ02466.1 hypothetical protein [Chloroflexota bacterium]